MNTITHKPKLAKPTLPAEVFNTYPCRSSDWSCNSLTLWVIAIIAPISAA